MKGSEAQLQVRGEGQTNNLESAIHAGRLLERRGFKGLLFRCVDTLRLIGRKRVTAPEATASDALEQRFGSRCPTDLCIQSSNAGWSLPYQPSSEEIFRKALERVTVRHSDLDATEFTLPSEPTILYLFNPFQGRLMDRMIQNVRRSLQQRPRDLGSCM